jgi:hypothetical protein
MVLVFLAFYMLLDRFFKQQASKNENERQVALRREIFSARIQAYERIILLLERISPNQLILRLNKQGLAAARLQSVIVQNIRDEFDHNLSQQLYISSKAWEMVRTAREEMIRLINTAAASVSKEAPSAEMATKMLELHAGLESDPVAKAIEFVKHEARSLFDF